MKQVRVGVFETNSSSTHSLVICTKEEYAKFLNGELLISPYETKLISPFEIGKNGGRGYVGYNVWATRLCDPFYHEYETPSGDKIVVFGDAEYGC